MICDQVRPFIDRLPAREWTREMRAAITKHVGSCTRCKQALEAVTAMEAEILALPEIEAPADMAEAIAARIAELPVPVQATEPVEKPCPLKDLRPWAALAPGALTAFAASLYLAISGGQTPELVNAKPMGGWLERMVEMQHAGPGVYVLAAGLILFTIGLFALPSTDNA
jgi:hypothetical protein